MKESLFGFINVADPGSYHSLLPFLFRGIRVDLDISLQFSDIVGHFDWYLVKVEQWGVQGVKIEKKCSQGFDQKSNISFYS